MAFIFIDGVRDAKGKAPYATTGDVLDVQLYGPFPTESTIRSLFYEEETFVTGRIVCIFPVRNKVRVLCQTMTKRLR